MWLIPAHENLFKLDTGGQANPEGELGFVRDLHDPAIAALDGLPFDWIILDTPPAQSRFTRLALAASHHVLLPANAEALAVTGAGHALQTARTMRGLMGTGIEFLGCVITAWKKSPEATRAETDLTVLAQTTGSRVYSKKIPLDGRIEKANFKTIGGWIKNIFHLTTQTGPAAKAYEALVKEMMPYVHRN